MKMNRYIFVFTFQRKKLRVFGLALLSTLLVVGCAGLMVMISLAGWELFKRPTTVAAQGQIDNSPQPMTGLMAASISQPRAMTRPTARTASVPSQAPIVFASPTSVVTPTPLASPIPITPTATPSPSPTASPTAIASPTLLPSPTALPLRVINPMGVATRLVIPKINLDLPVLLAPFDQSTWRVDHLEQAIGQLEGTSPPGGNSNIVLAGHVTLDWNVSGPFAQLSQLSPGDLVLVYERDQGYLYQIDTLDTVDHTNVEVTYPSDSGEITLITCTTWNDAEGRYVDRLVVKGRLVGRY
jgi:LPXTG-site transpeptidase (sortase) family protein